MPSITEEKEIKVEVETEFEVFCAECGAGICGSTTVRKSRGREMPQLEVFCPDCKAKYVKLQDDYDKLEGKLENLEKENKELLKIINELEGV